MSNGKKKTRRRIVVFGYGAQGAAHAENLRDSGKTVIVSLRKTSPRVQDVRDAGIPLITNPKKAAKMADIAALLIPDGEQPAFWRDVLAPNLPEGATVVFAHGYNIHYKLIVPRSDLDVILVAPMAQGETVRSNYVAGLGIPCVMAIAQNGTGKAKRTALEYARGISKTGPYINSTVAEEVETDLFAEQAVLCGGITSLVKNAFETLVENGYNADIAYFACLQEIRAIGEILCTHGITGLRDRISDTAQFGDVTRGPRIIGHKVREEMERALGEIRDGKFAQELKKDNDKGRPLFRKLYQNGKRHQIERIHRKFNTHIE